ncbi:hypothetical protein C0J52_17184 [Blattella germanica]|nr:hypothetical protein C0J52_17184 [Blattella germanica]
MAISSPAKKISTGVGDNDVNARSNSGASGKEPSPGPRTQDAPKLTNENSELREALEKTSQLLKDKTDLCDNQERQNLALTNQIASLKEVVAITKDLLNIRNMEVKHLQSDVESMEGKIADERERHNTMIVKMDEAVQLNSDLKKEYETQLKIFQDLRNKYEEKVALLMKENHKLEGQISMSKGTVPTQLEEQPTNNESNTLE